jgi:hypothetical protein
MTERDQHDECGCGCDGGYTRREFLGGGTGLALAGMTYASLPTPDDPASPPTPRTKEPAVIRAAFLYPPSEQFSGPDGWWSWPGNFFDAEQRQRQYMAELSEMERRLGVRIVADPTSIGTVAQAEALAGELRENRPDGLLLVVFYNMSNAQWDLLLEVAEELDIPTIFYVGLGVVHQLQLRPQWRRPGVYFIESLDNLAAIESGVRMIHARRRMAQSLLLSITEAPEPREGVEPFWGTRVRVVPFERYAEAFHAAPIDADTRNWIDSWVRGAREVRWINQDQSMEAAARAHWALKRLLAEHDADGLTMNCLRRGMLKPCIGFAELNGQLIPAACENDLPALYTYLLGTLLTGRAGFQGNPAYETERNHFYLSHCTCPVKLHGPEEPASPYLLTRFAHSNEGSCANQVFWPQGEPVTMVRYYPGDPPALDVYAGKVVKSHPMPPAAGCTTNVELHITDRPDVFQVKGHHNVLFAGDFARRFRQFANLYKMRLADTGGPDPWSV